MELIDALLGHSFIIVLLLRPQIDKIDVHFSLRCTVFVDRIIRCLSFREDATSIIPLFDSRRSVIYEARIVSLVFTDLYRTVGTLIRRVHF